MDRRNAASSANGADTNSVAASRVLALACVLAARFVVSTSRRGSAVDPLTTEADGVCDSTSMHPRVAPSIPSWEDVSAGQRDETSQTPRYSHLE